jgi:hypothetical protein
MDVTIYVLVLFQTFRSEFLLQLPRALSADVFLGIGSDADNASVSDDTDADADGVATSDEAAQREREANEVDALRAAAVLVEVRPRSLREIRYDMSIYRGGKESVHDSAEHSTPDQILSSNFAL